MNLPLNRPLWQKWSAHIALGLAGVNLLAIFIYLGNRENLLHPVWIYLTLYFVAYGFFLYAGRAVQLRRNVDERVLLWLILGFAIAFRLAVVFGPASLSTDIYRYVWDGRLTCHWINPYRWSPWDPRLAGFRDPAIWQPMEYKAYQTVYMPMSQLVFAAAYAIFRDSLTGFKLIFTAFDIGICLLIVGVLRRTGKDPARAIWYAWCPLPIVEVSLAGHQDVTGIFLLMLAIYLLTRGNHRLAALGLAAAGLTKGFALLLLPLFARRCGRRLLAPMAAGIVYLGLPLWVYAPEFLHGMQQYLDYVHVNSGLFTLIDRVLAFATRYHYEVTAKLSDIAILTAVGWSIWKRPPGNEDVIRRAILVMAACLLVVPTLFPWYVLWLLPLVAIYGSRPSAAFICLAGTVDLVYIYYLDRYTYAWIPIVEYVPVLLLFIAEWRRGYWRPATLAGGVPAVSDSDKESDGAVEPEVSADASAVAGGAEATW